MRPLLDNKFIRFIGIGIITIILIFIFQLLFATTSFSLNSARNTGLSDSADVRAPSRASDSFSKESVSLGEMGMMAPEAPYYPPTPVSSGYTADLETYETTSYYVTARTRQFDKMCDTLRSLKSGPNTHFKYINESTNNCNGLFYVDENDADSVLKILTSFSDAEYTRNTESVTRYRAQIQSQTSILQQQLGNVQRSLSAAESQLNNLNSIYLNSEDVATLSLRVNESLRLIDQLTQRKIGLTSQLNNLYQQAADLKARMDVVEFSVIINRSNPLYVNKDSQKWERAWDDLSDAYTDTLIGLTAFFGILLLWSLRLAVYGIVLIVLARLLWKFIKKLWSIG